MENRSHALMTGFFTIALVIAAILAGIWFNRDRVTRVPYLIATTIAVPGLNPQAAVRYRGIEVGKIDDISFDPKVAGQILVHIQVDPDAPITNTTYATLGYQGVTGIAYIQLDDDKTGSPLMASKDGQLAHIPLRPGLLDQLEKRGKEILATTDELTKRIDNLMSPANQKIIIGTFDNISKTAQAYGDIPRQLEPTLAALPDLTARANKAIKDFDTFSTDASATANKWSDLATNLQAKDGAIAKLNRTMDQVGGALEGTLSDIEQQTLPHVTAMTDEARTSLRAVKRTMNTLNERPQSLIFGGATTPPGPGEPGFVAPSK